EIRRRQRFVIRGYPSNASAFAMNGGRRHASGQNHACRPNHEIRHTAILSRMVRLLLFLLAGALAARPDVAPQPVPVTYEAFALRFGMLPAFPVSVLVACAAQSRTIVVPVIGALLMGICGSCGLLA